MPICIDHSDKMRNQFEKCETKERKMSTNGEYKQTQTRKRIRKRQVNDGNTAETDLSPRDKLRVETFNLIIGTLKDQMQRRDEVYNEVSQISFLTDLKKSYTEYEKDIESLLKACPGDFDNNFIGELNHFHKFVQKQRSHIPICMREIIKDEVKCVFPNKEVAFRTFHSLMITNCSAKRPFSQLKRQKNSQRTKICQDKLKSLAILCIEADIQNVRKKCSKC